VGSCPSHLVRFVAFCCLWCYKSFIYHLLAVLRVVSLLLSNNYYTISASSFSRGSPIEGQVFPFSGVLLFFHFCNFLICLSMFHHLNNINISSQNIYALIHLLLLISSHSFPPFPHLLHSLPQYPSHSSQKFHTKMGFDHHLICGQRLGFLCICLLFLIVSSWIHKGFLIEGK